MTRTEEHAWLLEKAINGRPHWIGVIDHFLNWTDDPNKALRLARREDADKLAEICEDAEKVTEHIWSLRSETTICPRCGATSKELQCCDYPPHLWHERDEAIKQRQKYVEMVGLIRESNEKVLAALQVAKQTTRANQASAGPKSNMQ